MFKSVKYSDLKELLKSINVAWCLNCINLTIHLSRIINIRKFSSSTWLLLGLADLYFYGSIVKIFVQRTYQYRSHGTCDTYVVTLQFAVICCNSSLAQEAIPESSTTCDLYLASGEGRPAEGGWQLETVGRHRPTGNFKRWSLNNKTQYFRLRLYDSDCSLGTLTIALWSNKMKIEHFVPDGRTYRQTLCHLELLSEPKRHSVLTFAYWLTLIRSPGPCF